MIYLTSLSTEIVHSPIRAAIGPTAASTGTITVPKTPCSPIQKFREFCEAISFVCKPFLFLLRKIVVKVSKSVTSNPSCENKRYQTYQEYTNVRRF